MKHVHGYGADARNEGLAGPLDDARDEAHRTGGETLTDQLVPPPAPADRAFKAAAARWPDRPAFDHGGRATVYRNLDARADQASGALRRLGAGPGVRIGLLLPGGGPAALAYTLGAFRAGASVVPLDPAAGIDRLAADARLAGVRLIVTTDQAASLAKAAALIDRDISATAIVCSHTAMLPLVSQAVARLFRRAQTAAVPANLGGRMRPERDLLRDTSAEAVVPSGPPPRPAEMGDVAFAVPSQVGGRHVLVELTQSNIAHNMAQLRAALAPLTGPADQVVCALPACHPLSLVLALNLAWSHGADVTFIGGDEPEAITAAAGRRRGAASLLIAPTPLVARLLAADQPEAGQNAAWSVIVAVGGHTGEHMAARAAQASRHGLVSVAYLDAVPVAVAAGRIEPGPDGAGGALLAMTHAVVHDLADPARTVARGERGEVCLTGPQLPGPAGLHPATGRFAGDGLKTGELGLVDKAGRLILLDRTDDIIVAAGYRIHPSRIEAALRAHPHVVDAAVIGVGDDRRGMAPKAFVVLARGAPVTERDLRTFLAERISRIEMPADIDFSTGLPRTALGLPCKATLRERETARRTG